MMMKSRIMLFLLLLGLVGAAPIFAGSAALGTVAGSLNATVSGQALLSNSTIFNGDQLQVKDGAAVIALVNGSRLTLGSQTEAQFLRESDGVAVALGKGHVSMYHPANGSQLTVNVEKWSVTPGQGYKTVGEVAMLNGAVIVTAKEGSLHVAGNGQAVDVAQGKTITLLPKDAATPQTGASQKLVGGNEALEGATLAAAGVAAGFGIGALIEAKDAKNNANAATSAANAATSAANAAGSAAAAAGSAAAAADSDAVAAGAAANAAGCAIDALNPKLSPSPYIPPGTFVCP